MNNHQQAWILPLAGSLFLAAASASAAEPPPLERVYLDSTNRLTGSIRFGLNISGKFTSPGGSLNPNRPAGNGQHTPHGNQYNYDDGYVYPDNTGSHDGMTWFWGYNNASQLNASGPNSIDFHHTTAPGLPGSNSGDDSPYVGCEITYDYELGRSDYGLEDKDGWNHFRFGIEGAANFMPINFNSGGSYNTSLNTTTTTYGYTPGTTPPGAPYQGPFNGPGFVINSVASGSSPSVIPGATVNVQQHFDSTLWGFRLGPYLESPVTENFAMHITGGLAVGILSASANWKETVSLQAGSLPSGVPATTSGSGDDTSVLWGYYFGADAVYRFDEHWAVDLGVQYQDLGTYTHNFGGRMAELDLSHSLFLQAGVSFSF
jgi:hypothetical protein